MRGVVASSRCSGKLTSRPESVPVALWRRAVPLTASDVEAATQSGSVWSGSLPPPSKVNSKVLDDPVVTLKRVSWKYLRNCSVVRTSACELATVAVMCSSVVWRGWISNSRSPA